MKLLKRVLTLIGVMSLIAASMVAGNVAAQSIETTLTVDTSAPACADAIPSSISISAPTAFPAAGITPTNPPSTTIIRQNGSTTVNFRINACHEGTAWRVSASTTNFTSGTNSINAVGTVHIRGSRGVNNNQDFTGLVGQGFSGPVVVGAWQSNMTVALGYVPYTGEAIVVSQGTGTRPGGFSQFLQWGISNIPSNTPPGTYVASNIVTLSVGEP